MNKNEQIKRINKLTVIAVMLCILSFGILPMTGVIPTVYGANQVTESNKAQDNTYQTEYVRQVLDNDMFVTIIMLVTGEAGEGLIPYCLGTYSGWMPTGGIGTNGDILGPVFITFKVIGFLLCVAIALGHLFQRMERGEEGFQPIGKVLIEIGIVGIFIMNLEKILGLIIQLGLAIMGEVAAPVVAGELSTEAAEGVLQAITGTSTGSSLWQAEFTSHIGGMFNLANIASIAGVTIFCSYAVEMGIRRLFCPLAIIDIYQEGLRSSGARYLKKIFANVLKLAMCLTVCYIVSNPGFNVANGLVDIQVKNAKSAILRASGGNGDVVKKGFAALKAFKTNPVDAISQLFGASNALNETKETVKDDARNAIYLADVFLKMKIALVYTGVAAMAKVGDVANDVVGV